jgi:putative hydrolase of the HAD superfamily
MIPPDVRAVFFDAVGTLIHPEPSAAVVYATVARALDSRLSEEEIATRFRTAFAREDARDRANGWRTSEERERQRWRGIVAKVLDDVADGECCFLELFTHFGRPEAWRCDPETAGILTELERRGYVLGMASNYDARLNGVVAGLPELRPLRHVVTSSEVGWRKPAREFFDALLGRVGLAPSQVLYVGNDRANDYEGALAAGLRAMLIGTRNVRGLRELIG